MMRVMDEWNDQLECTYKVEILVLVEGGIHTQTQRKEERTI